MRTNYVERYISTEVVLSSNNFGGTTCKIEVKGSTITFRACSCMTELNALEAKKNPSRIANCISVLDESIYEYELENVTRFVLGLI